MNFGTFILLACSSPINFACRFKQPYGPEGTEKFDGVLSFTFCGNWAAYGYSLLMLRLAPDRSKDERDTIPAWCYVTMSVLSLLSNLATYQAITDVMYITVVIGKSIEPIPILVCGMLCGGKRFSLSECFSVATVVIGMIIFLHEPHLFDSRGHLPRLGTGAVLLLASLICDGFLAAVQERVKAWYQPTPLHLLKGTSLWQVIFSSGAMVVTSELGKLVAFTRRNPEIGWQLFSSSASRALAGVKRP